MQNKAPLLPDHGAPLRLIVPGWIGGRMVKWLEEIAVTAEPSDNFYHFNDNRILPPDVDAERATAEGWWCGPVPAASLSHLSPPLPPFDTAF